MQGNYELESELKEKLAKSVWYSKEKREEETIRMHTDCLLEQAALLLELKYITDDEYRILTYVCEKHDYGKINKRMQERLKKGEMRFNANNEVQHNILSALFVNREDFQTENMEKWEEDYIVALYAVLYHHNTYTGEEHISILKFNPIVREFAEQYAMYSVQNTNKKIFRRALKKIEELIEIRENENGDETFSEEYMFRKALFNRMAKMKGLLHKCDYSASAHIPCEYKNDFLLQSLNNLLAEWGKESWNELQRFSLENTEKNIIVTAPTGSGKTEAGFLWAGNHKCFYILPLKTAINAMYDRVKRNIIKEDNVKERVALLHSDMLSYYVNDYEENIYNKNLQNYDIDSIMDYMLQSRQMSLPITISTMDQIFDFVLKYYGYEYKLSTLSYSKVIIDEIQMYTPELLAYIVYGIKKIIEFGGKVAVLTATLPPFVKDRLLEVMGDDVKIKDFSYLGKDRHNLRVLNECLTAKKVFEYWKERKDKESRKFLIICNSVYTAQKIYKQLNELFHQENRKNIDNRKNMECIENIKINLLHSRFIRKDRREKEKAIIETGKTFNEDGTINKSDEIWISTSVVEASLDIDFDYLFTELLDLFSLFQRLGRVNRKGVKNIKEYNCFIYTRLQDAPLKYYLEAKEFQYTRNFQFVDKDVYEYSKEAILTVDGILSEKEKIKLIETYLSSDKLEKTMYIKKYRNQFKILENLCVNETKIEKKSNVREIQNIDIVPLNVYMENKKIIDEAEKKLIESTTSAVERIKAIEIIQNYIVSVPAYMVKQVKEINKHKKLNRTNKTIKLRRNYEVGIIDCEYSYEMGVERKK